MSKHYFLFVLLSLSLVQAQVLTPVSNCLGNCLTCDPLALTKCKAPLPCQWGFYAPKTDSTCVPIPTVEILSAELGDSADAGSKVVASGWSRGSKTSMCQYLSSEGTRYLQALGFFQGVEMLQKTFKVDSASDIFQLSFNLLHDGWLPFNDFLIIDVSSRNQNIETVEISYDKKISIASRPAVITCDGKRVLSDKFNVKLYNTQGKIQDSITVLFTSFLYSSSWAVSNVRLLSGCVGYTRFNASSETCNICDQDSYLVTQAGASWCQKCPSLCLTCQSQTKCLTCVDGAMLNDVKNCIFPEKFKTQLLEVSSGSSCDGIALQVSSSGKEISFPELKNEQNLLYDQIQIGFYLYYFPSDWTQASNGSFISVTINAIEVMRLDYRNLTNSALNLCSAFVKGKAARIEIFSKGFVHTDNVVRLSFQLKGNKPKEFAVANLLVKSIRKDKPSALQPISPTAELPNNNVSTLSNIPQQASTNASNQIKNNLSSPTGNGEGKSDNIISALPMEGNRSQSAPINESEPIKSAVILQPVSHLNGQIQPAATEQDATPASTTAEQPAVQEQTIPLAPTVIGPPAASSTTKPIQVPSNLKQNDSALQEQVKEQNSGNIGYLPASNGKKSGVQVYIDNQPQGRFLYNVTIDKLSSEDYSIDSYYSQDARINMFVNINRSFAQGTLSVYRHSVSRLLQQDSTPVLVGTFKISRFDSLSEGQIQSVQRFATLFVVAAWVGVILIIIAVMCGCGIVVEEYVLALQVIFLHAYIASDELPLTFRDIIGGLSLIENLNFFAPAHSESIEAQWMGNVLQTGPVRFYLFNTDINFLREFFPIIIVNIIYLLWFGCVFLARRLINRDLIDEEKGLGHKLIDNIAGRVVNFADQIWRYQFLATMWFCFIQFYNLAYPEGSNRNQAINGIICIAAFLCSLAWPAFVTLHCRKQYYEREYSQYLYKFQDIYCMRIPQYELPSIHHRMWYPLFKAAKLFVIALTVCYAGNVATLALVVLMTVHVFQLIYIKKEEIYTEYRYFLLKLIENSVFVAIELILLALLNFSSVTSSDSYVSMGFVLASVAVLVVINASVRVGYLGYSKYVQLVEELGESMVLQKKMKTERVV